MYHFGVCSRRTHKEMIQSYREKYNEAKANRDWIRSEIEKKTEQLNSLKKRHELSLRVQERINRVARQTQQRLEVGISHVVTNAIQSIPFKEKFDFAIEFVQRRGKTECDLWSVARNKEKCDPLGATGYGVCDVESLALLCVFKKLKGGRQTLILDEPFRNVSINFRRHIAEMTKVLCDELGLQMIIVSHVMELIDVADNVIEL